MVGLCRDAGPLGADLDIRDAGLPVAVRGNGGGWVRWAGRPRLSIASYPLLAAAPLDAAAAPEMASATGTGVEYAC